MDTSKYPKSHKTINVILFTKYKLICHHLGYLLEKKSNIKIQHFVSTAEELLRKLSDKTDVVLFCLLEGEAENIEIMPRMFENFPNTKALVLSTLNGELDQTRVLKLGASGIVDAKQSEEALIRAIRQVSEGGVCLNQNLINQILNGDKRDRKSGDQKSDGVPGGIYGNDPLTDRELEVIKVISKGLSNKEISKKMFISEATVRHHLSSIYSKLFIEDRLNLVIYAFKNKLVFPQETIEAE